MNSFPYNLNDKNSIIQYAKKLINKTLREVCKEDLLENQRNKGNFGQLLEKFYFLYDPNSDNNPDFKEVGLELKTTPLKKLKRLDLVSKEKLVLNIINYLEIVNQDFENSSFWKKNKNLLIIFYLHETGKKVIDFKIDIVDEWIFPEIDLEIIKKDWNTICEKIKIGKAHELSEGDTLYLAASTKGSKGGSSRVQPYNKILAKQRAFSLKQGYVNHIIATLSGNVKINYGKIIPILNTIKSKSLEEIVISKFDRYLNKNINEIELLLNLELNHTAKNFYSNIVKAILGIELGSEIEEFQKAGIVVKTIRLNVNNLPKEQISFPSFKFKEIIKQKWEESRFYNILEQKFLFIFFKIDEENILRLSTIKFWNMPYSDKKEAKKVWKATKNIIINGDIVKSISKNKKGKVIRKTNFPNKSSNNVAHVRPHALNSNDTYPLPTIDKITNADTYTKHCFWLNAYYVKNEIYLK